MDKINVGGIYFNNVTMDEALLLMDERIKEYDGGPSSLLLVANQDIINRVRSPLGISLDQLNKGFLTIPDGFSIVYASKYLGTPLKERVTGPDLMAGFLKRSPSFGYKHFFLGAREGVAQTMADILRSKHPGLEVCGVYSPPFGDFSDEENNKMITMINDAKPDVLWVSFGCPKQEKWIIEHCDRLKVPIAAGIGAAFDFLSNNVRRAPLLIRKMRLEWFFRFLQEPGRLGERYFGGGVKFIRTIMKQKRERV